MPAAFLTHIREWVTLVSLLGPLSRHKETINDDARTRRALTLKHCRQRPPTPRTSMHANHLVQLLIDAGPFVQINPLNWTKYVICYSSVVDFEKIQTARKTVCCAKTFDGSCSTEPESIRNLVCQDVYINSRNSYPSVLLYSAGQNVQAKSVITTRRRTRLDAKIVLEINLYVEGDNYSLVGVSVQFQL